MARDAKRNGGKGGFRGDWTIDPYGSWGNHYVIAGQNL